jgi:hypothetical protein
MNRRDFTLLAGAWLVGCGTTRSGEHGSSEPGCCRNMLTDPNAFERWLNCHIDVIPDASIAPDGTLTADRIVPNGELVGHAPYQSVVLEPFTDYTMAVSVKAAGYGFVRMLFSDGTHWALRTFDLLHGSLGHHASNAGFAPAAATMTPEAHGFHRCELRASSLALTTGFFYLMINPDDGDAVYAGDGISGIFAWYGKMGRR